MQFDDGGTRLLRSLDLRGIRRDKERNAAVRRQKLDRIAKRGAPRNDIEPAFGGTLGALLRNETDGVRFHAPRNPDHLFRCRHFEIERRRYFLHPLDIAVHDMTAVFPQMHRDAVCAGGDGRACRAQRIGVKASARIADGGDMIDVHAQTDWKFLSH